MTNRQLQIGFGTAIGAFVGMGIEALRLQQKQNQLVENHNDMVEKHERALAIWISLNEQMRYMVSILEDRGVDLTEFDLIALTNIHQILEDQEGV